MSTIVTVIIGLLKSLLVEGVIRNVVIILLKMAVRSLKTAARSSTNKLDDDLVYSLEQIVQVITERWNQKV